MLTLPKYIILESSYFPPIGFIELIKTYPFYIDDNERFIKQSLRNRTYILSANGRIPLIIPVKAGKTLLQTNQVEIDYSTPWQTIHIKTLQSSYGNSPFFDYFIEDIKAILTQRHKYLIDINQEILAWILKRIKTSNHLLIEPIQSNEAIFDCKDAFHPKLQNRNLMELQVEINPYIQVFSDRYPFDSEVSCLDKVFCTGKL